jgi:hypothetical protein
MIRTFSDYLQTTIYFTILSLLASPALSITNIESERLKKLRKAPQAASAWR